MSAITAKASRKMKKYAVLTREPRCFLGSFDFSWEQRKLASLCEKFKDGDWIESKDQSDFGVRLVQTGNVGVAEYLDKTNNKKWISEDTFDRLHCEEVLPGDILISRLPEPAGRACIVPLLGTKMITAVDCTIVRTAPDMSNKFLVQYLSSQAYFDDVNTCLAGGTRQRISRGNLANFNVPIPVKKSEQDAIGMFFGYLDNLITLHQRKCALLFSPFQAFISMMFTTSTFSWEQRKLGEIGSVSMCRRIFKEQTSETGDIPFYKIGTFGADPDAFISRELFEEYKSKYPYPQKGDILISASGSIGRTVEFAGNNEYFQDSNIVWLNHDERLSNPFLKCFYSVVKWAGIEGSTIKRLYNDNILNTVICMPSVPEQKRIGLFFENLDNLITLHQRKCIFFTGRAGRLISTVNKKRITSSWEQRKLSEITDKVTEKNAGLQYVETFTNSAEFGIISQRDFFDHDIAKLGSLDGYYIVKTEDFVYNPRISTSAPVGPINRNKLGRTGVMSPLYTVFRPHDIDTTYLEYFFKCGYWHSFMNFNGDSGARSDRFSIRDNVFFQMPIPIPDIDEQRKIGELLTCLDNLITLHQRKPFLMKWRTSDANRNQTNRLVL